MNTKLCLNMIVKNESKNIKRCLNSLYKYLDYWVICDTGSSDGTQDIVKNFFKSKSINGELHQTVWENYEKNRNEALNLAFGKCDYILLCDADMELIVSENFSLDTSFDTFMVKQKNSNLEYYNVRVINSKKEYKYYSPTHEYIKAEFEGEKIKNIDESDFYFLDHCDGFNRKDKLKNDVNILEKKISEDSEDSRSVFYLAQTYKDLGENEKALNLFFKRIDMGGYNEERYVSCLYSGRLMRLLNFPEREIESIFLKGQQIIGDRVECLYELSEYYRLKGEYLKSYVYANYAIKIKFPKNRFLFLEKEVYDFKIKDELAISSYYVGKYNKSFNTNRKLLVQKYNKRIVENMDYCVPFLALKMEKYKSLNIKTDKNKNGVVFTITSCKRFDLFQKSINSVINAVKDIKYIDRFICIDDNSSEEDRYQMKKLYPFFEFVFKDEKQKGHAVSMNMLVEMLDSSTKHIFHMEDDWTFLRKSKYIQKSLKILNEQKNFGQVFFNKNYAEKILDYNIYGGIYIKNKKYLMHEYGEDVHKGKIAPDEYLPHYLTCSYWPHFSLRPSIIKREVFDKIGKFNEEFEGICFEKKYAERYSSYGYVSIFHNSINMIHTGKHTLDKDKDKDNAYSLNSIKQWEDKVEDDTLCLKEIIKIN